MTALSDDDLELWLSRYIDNELEPAEKEAVEAKLRNNEKWRAEFESMQKSDTTIQAVAIRFHDDEEYGKRITAKLQPVAGQKAAAAAVAKTLPKPPPTHRRLSFRRSAQQPESAWPLGLAALVVLVLCGGIVWKLQTGNDDNPGSRQPPPIPKSPYTVVTEEMRVINWPDGTRILARKGSSIMSIDSRTLKLSGEAFFHVAKNAKPFTVITGEGNTIQALGTRFEVATIGDLARVRVAEGRVRIQYGIESSKSLDVQGGTDVSPELKSRKFDPRELYAVWNHGEEIVAPWSQSGGSAGHTGTTPLSGPSALVSRKEAFFAFPEKSDAPTGGAVISFNNRAYIVIRKDGATQLMELRLDGHSQWTTCAAFTASLEISPVITPYGLVVTGNPDGSVSAYDSNSRTAVWTQKAEKLHGLCAAPDESVLLSTQAGLIALDGRNGIELWRCNEATDLIASATIMPSGLICVTSDKKVYTIDGGKLVATFDWNHSISQPPVSVPALIALDMDQVWLTSADGFVACMALDKGSRVEKTFPKLNCGPIATGLMGVGSNVMHFDQQAALTAPAEDTVVALVGDRRNEHYAGYRRGVLHIKARTPGEVMAQLKDTDFANLPPNSGEIVKNGLAILPGKLIVTTTKGLQVFE